MIIPINLLSFLSLIILIIWEAYNICGQMTQYGVIILLGVIMVSILGNGFRLFGAKPSI